MWKQTIQLFMIGSSPIILTRQENMKPFQLGAMLRNEWLGIFYIMEWEQGRY